MPVRVVSRRNLAAGTAAFAEARQDDAAGTSRDRVGWGQAVSDAIDDGCGLQDRHNSNWSGFITRHVWAKIADRGAGARIRRPSCGGNGPRLTEWTGLRLRRWQPRPLRGRRPVSRAGQGTGFPTYALANRLAPCSCEVHPRAASWRLRLPSDASRARLWRRRKDRSQYGVPAESLKGATGWGRRTDP
jgi:hypothetical protein